MIVAYTRYDRPTKILSRVAKELIHQAGSSVTQVLKPSTPSDAVTVQAKLGSSPQTPLVFLGHGTLSGLIAQDQPNLALHGGNLHLLNGSLVCGIACYSAQSLHNAVIAHGAVVLGYVDSLRIPAQKRYFADFRDCQLEPTKVLTRPMSNPKRTASDAEIECRQAYQRVERKLQAGTTYDQIIAVRVFRWNARSLQLNPPNSTRTL
jgi:hypothetical protein